ncbi:HAD hydrolase-like protein [Laspinema sp. D1]|uniref:HAD hydrolase-like protein n=1 Tax=Laspinema palackyanum D2a TaxID=2953684 RepID=A0ABT2MW80_9CYAN|nr:HAD hydrolase-like protein [Laspinema sp. D2a]
MTEIGGKYQVGDEQEIGENYSMTNLIIFDKDQTLVDSLCGERFIQSPTDQAILPGAAEAVQSFYERGFRIAIASNQGGVEARKKTLESAIEEMRFCLFLFPVIETGLIAPNYSGESAWEITQTTAKEISGDFGSFRKPGPGMLNYLMKLYQSTPSKTWFIGDRPEDEQAAESAGTQFIAADIVRARYLPGFSELQVNVEQLEFLEPQLKGVYRWE